MDMQILIIGAGIILIFVLLAIAFMGPNLAKASTRRLSAVKMRHSDSADSRVEQQMRKAVASRRPMIFTDGRDVSRLDKLRLRLAQTGKKWTLKQYLNVSGGLTFLVMTLLWLRDAPLLLALFGGVVVGAGLPHVLINFFIARRIKNFTANFPDAIELLVRGLKSGLPVAETLSVVATEVPGPVGEEFKMVTEKIKIGKSMEESLQETADRLGTAEFQFFVITLAIQRETGGNLAETLANLADVLRKRAQMKLKIRAMSSESKASAYIVGSLPFFVFGMVWMVNQEYLAGFFYEPRLMIAGLGGALWMSMGVFIMAKMVSFEI
ncbi:MAG: pilus assembly protein TadB [Sphingomonadales bacterium 17-56-6]|nr:MAG: pilus assembly protein TadB [Sphingomonadales bacterium 28-55-16]OYZ88988.1 MAG: pilus assembly protein TadB [Sphingomonadales bacterium 17-56-6]